VAREVLLVGGVPLRPAAAVFETVASELATLVTRIPDGDQHGWIVAAVASFEANPALARTGRVALSAGGAEVPLFGPRQQSSTDGLVLGPYGYAKVAEESYREFCRLRDAGVIATDIRFQVTLPGPGTSAFMVQVAPEPLLRIARSALAREIEEILEVVPARELTIQLDLAMEAEHEEYRRRPAAFDTPVHDTFDWTSDQMADSAAWLAEQVPTDAELGFHVCSIWHHYQPGGQDNAVLVDTVNAVASRVRRPITYFHVPTIPEHDGPDFAPLGDLCLGSGTRVFLGVIHQSDGVEGARRRIGAARAFLPDFGVASFCGLGSPAVADATTGSVTVGDALHAELRNIGGTALARSLALHRQVAALP
jgi:hypothetical protein